VFTTHDIVDVVLDQIMRAAGENAFEVAAYVFMPDHLHLLIEGRSESSDLRRFAHAAKQYSGFAYKRSTGKRLWQPSYYDHVLRDDDDTWGVARYLVGNPIRAGLVQNAAEYPFLGSSIVGVKELLEFAQSAPRWFYEP
jgi:putative transposase